jgi:tRNA(Ile)-lysidine synthase TilS/MesJ
MPRRISSTLRRHFKADRLLFSSLIIMRACSFCRAHNFFYVIAPESPYCERYFRSYLKCELTLLDAKVERLLKKKERLTSEIAAVYAKITRFRKQYRAVMKKLRDLGSRKDRNIFELKMDEMIVNDLSKMS